MQVRGSLGSGLLAEVEATDMEHLWVAQSGRQALGVGPSGIGHFRADQSSVASWPDVVSVTLALGRLVVVTLKDGTEFEFPVARLRDARDLVAAIPESQRERLGLTSDTLPTAGPPTSASPSVAGARVPQPQQQGPSLWGLLLSGAALQIVGGFVLAASWPSTDVDSLTGELVAEGSSAGVIFALLLASAGAMLMLVAVIAFGVRYGMAAARQDERRT